MHVTKTQKYDLNLVLEPNQLQQLLSALGLTDRNLRYSVDCSDGTTLKPALLEEVFSFPNPDHRAIRRFEVSTDFEGPLQIDLTFGYSLLSNGTVSYRLSGEDRDVSATASIIEDHLRGMFTRPLLSRGKVEWSGIALLAIGMSVLPWALGTSASQFQLHHRISPGIYVAAVGVLTAILGRRLPDVAQRLWPATAFLIGDGRKRYEKLAELRRNFFWTVVVGGIVALATGWLVVKLTS